MMNFFRGTRHLLVKNLLLLLLVLPFLFPSSAAAQSAGSLRGQVLDPSGAAIPGATVTLTQGAAVLNAQSGDDGAYVFKTVPAGSYTLQGNGNGSVNGRGLSGSQAQPKLDATVARKYSLTLIGGP